MAEYIDKEEMIRQITCDMAEFIGAPDEVQKHDEQCNYAICMIENATTVDAVPVVRCKDCVHWDDDPDTYGTDYGPKGKCMKSFETMCADDFCSHGERKDSDNAA